MTALAAFFSASLAALPRQWPARRPHGAHLRTNKPAWWRLGFQERNSDKTNGVFPWPWLSGAMSTSNNRCQSRVAQSFFFYSAVSLLCFVARVADATDYVHMQEQDAQQVATGKKVPTCYVASPFSGASSAASIYPPYRLKEKPKKNPSYLQVQQGQKTAVPKTLDV